MYNRVGETITPPVEGSTIVEPSESHPVRIEVLQQLAELAMSDEEFRAAANDDLEKALDRFGFALTPQELALVLRFRRSLADAGVDLDLVSGMGEEQLSTILERLQRRARSAP